VAKQNVSTVCTSQTSRRRDPNVFMNAICTMCKNQIRELNDMTQFNELCYPSSTSEGQLKRYRHEHNMLVKVYTKHFDMFRKLCKKAISLSVEAKKTADRPGLHLNRFIYFCVKTNFIPSFFNMKKLKVKIDHLDKLLKQVNAVDIMGKSKANLKVQKNQMKKLPGEKKKSMVYSDLHDIMDKTIANCKASGHLI